jgi:hypothetical protein
VIHPFLSFARVPIEILRCPTPITLNLTNHKKNGNRKPYSKNKISAYSAPISRLKDDRLRETQPPPFRGRSLFGRRSEFPVSGRSSVGTRFYTLTFMMHCTLVQSIRVVRVIDFQLCTTSELFLFGKANSHASFDMTSTRIS